MMATINPFGMVVRQSDFPNRGELLISGGGTPLA